MAKLVEEAVILDTAKMFIVGLKNAIGQVRGLMSDRLTWKT